MFCKYVLFMKNLSVLFYFQILLIGSITFTTSKAYTQVDSLKVLYNSATSVEEKLKHLDNIARLYNNLQLDSAKVYAKREIILALENENSKYQARGYNWLGRAYLLGGYSDTAIIYYRKCYEVSTLAKNDLYAAYSLQSIANYYLEKSIKANEVYRMDLPFKIEESQRITCRPRQSEVTKYYRNS